MALALRMLSLSLLAALMLFAPLLLYMTLSGTAHDLFARGTRSVCALSLVVRGTRAAFAPLSSVCSSVALRVLSLLVALALHVLFLCPWPSHCACSLVHC